MLNFDLNFLIVCINSLLAICVIAKLVIFNFSFVKDLFK